MKKLTQVVILIKEGDAILEFIQIKVRLHIGDLKVDLEMTAQKMACIISSARIDQS